MEKNEKNNNSERIDYIDFLKFLGLTGIIIAHVGSPRWAFMLRNFDVPLMVILSSLLGAAAYQRCKISKVSSFDYFVRRIKRLVIPVWIFLFFYFAVHFLLLQKVFSLKYYISSFLLTKYGIGYVWVILAYLYSALAIPFWAEINFSKKSVFCLLMAYIIYEIAYYLHIGTTNKFIITTFYYILPYGGLLTFLGFNYNRMDKRKYIVLGISIVVFFISGLYYLQHYGALQNVQLAKYPPRCYYLSYGIAVSFALLIICEKVEFAFYKNPIIKFIAAHSMWIYLWHIAVLVVYKTLRLPKAWVIKFLIVYSVSTVIVYIINSLLDLIEEKKGKKINFFNFLRG